MANTPNTPIAVTEKTVGQYVADTLPALIKSYAVRDYNGAAWMKTAALAIVESKDLMDCLQTEAGKISLRHALRFAATTGLSLNPQEGMAALVPIGGKVSYWPMKNGLVELLLETGAVSKVRMNAVHANDAWRLTETIDGTNYEWAPARRNRGEIDLFFCAVRLLDGSSVVEVMNREEIEAYRKQYSPKSILSLEAYGIKTVTKRLCNRLKLPSEKVRALQAAVRASDEAEPAEFTLPEGKGASAEDVERKLAEQGQPPAPATGTGSGGAPAGAPGAQGSTPAEGQPGSQPAVQKEIF